MTTDTENALSLIGSVGTTRGATEAPPDIKLTDNVTTISGGTGPWRVMQWKPTLTKSSGGTINVYSSGGDRDAPQVIQWNASSNGQGIHHFIAAPQIVNDGVTVGQMMGADWVGFDYAPEYIGNDVRMEVDFDAAIWDRPKCRRGTGTPAVWCYEHYGLVYQPNWQTGAVSTQLAGLWIIPNLQNASNTTLHAVWDTPTISGGVTSRYGLRYAGHTGGGTVLNSYAVDVADQTVSTFAAALRSAMSSGTGKWSIYSSGTAASVHAGNVRLGDVTAPTEKLEVVGNVLVDSATGGPEFALRLGEDKDNGSEYVAHKAPAAITANPTFIWPADGTMPTDGQYLKCAISGSTCTLSGDSPAGSGTVTAVGPACTTGACFTDTKTTGGETNALIWEGTTNNTEEWTLVLPAEPAVDYTWTQPTCGSACSITFPNATSTVATTGLAETFSGVKTFGSAGDVGKLAIAGTTSGSTILNATATASGTLTLPAATDTLVAKATTDTLTEKTLNVESSGNVVTTVSKLWIPAAGCSVSTATANWDVTSLTAPVPNCEAGTNNKGANLGFDTATDECVQGNIKLPSDWTGALDVEYLWKAAATSGSVTWCSQFICRGDAETDDQAFPAQASTNCVSDAAKGTTLQLNNATDTSVDISGSGCTAGDVLRWRLCRDPDSTAGLTDDMTGDALLVGVELTLRRAQ